jgi:hypothetical protein
MFAQRTQWWYNTFTEHNVLHLCTSHISFRCGNGLADINLQTCLKQTHMPSPKGVRNVRTLINSSCLLQASPKTFITV